MPNSVMDTLGIVSTLKRGGDCWNHDDNLPQWYFKIYKYTDGCSL